MKKLKLTKVIASTLVVASILALNPIGASAEWRQDNRGWWYSEGSSWATGWRQIDSNWYYFYSGGYMAKDTTIDGYYLNSSGAWTTAETTSQRLIGKWKDESGKILTINDPIDFFNNKYTYIKIEDNSDHVVYDVTNGDYQGYQFSLSTQDNGKATMRLHNPASLSGGWTLQQVFEKVS